VKLLTDTDKRQEDKQTNAG